MQFYLHKVAATVSMAFFVGCNTSPQPPEFAADGYVGSLGGVLPKNYKCFTTADGNRRAGVVLRIDSDGTPWVSKDLSGLLEPPGPLDSPLGVGKITGNMTASAEMVANIVRQSGLNISSDLTSDDNYTLEVSFGDDVRHINLTDDHLKKVLASYLPDEIGADAQLYLIRDVIKTKKYRVSLSRDVARKFAANVQVASENPLGADYSRVGDSAYELDLDFDEYLGVCVRLQKLVEADGAGGPTIALEQVPGAAITIRDVTLKE